MNLQTEKAKSHLIAENLEKEILHGSLTPGARIQSVRALASRFEVSIKVIQTAFNILEQKELIERRHGSGTFIKEITASQKEKVVFLFLASRSIEESYHFQVFRGVCNEMRKHGFSVDLAMEYDISDLQKNYAGIIFSSTIDHATIKDVMKSKLPCVVYGNVANIKGLCEVTPDYFKGSVMAVDYLCSCNLQNIIFVRAAKEYNMRNEVCFEGYCSGLKKNNIPFDKDLVWNFSEIDEKLDIMHDELKKGNYVIYIPNDATAYDINKRLRKRGFKISKEIGIMGFYNRNYAQLANPSLTTVGFDHELMGVTVAQKLREIISSNKLESALIPVKIIKRESVSEPQRILAEV
jgi:GntR family transcriptional regulator, arabinose operon transcriptional repressor